MKNLVKYNNKKILVLGLARSGISAIRLLLETSAKITAYDKRSMEELEGSIPEDIRENTDIIYFLEPEKINVSGYDLIVTSPGVAPSNPIIRNAMDRNIQVVSELQIGIEALPENVTVIAVTGTNGKTTTCELIQYLTGGLLAGNIGDPLTGCVRDINSGDMLVLEVSSFQILFSPGLKPNVGVMLNIFPEHIEWHEGYDNYRAAKKEMFLKQCAGDFAVFNKNIQELEEFINGVNSEKLFFSSEEKVIRGIYSDGDDIIYADEFGSEIKLMSNYFSNLPGKHNLENILASLAVCKSLGIENMPDIGKFKLSPHRMENIGIFNGVKFINDSKATNMDSTLRALESVEAPVIILMGGRSKKQMHSGLHGYLCEKAEMIIAFGESRKEISGYFSSEIPVVEIETLKEATDLAYREAKPGTTVLMSPGGSSFDEFKDYCERGLKFKEWVQELAKK
jgi:UDP-N-acetylmuramoylalanine--D-glutamate ligase